MPVLHILAMLAPRSASFDWRLAEALRVPPVLPSPSLRSVTLAQKGDISTLHAARHF
jgi:hypothetical protein